MPIRRRICRIRRRIGESGAGIGNPAPDLRNPAPDLGNPAPDFTNPALELEKTAPDLVCRYVLLHTPRSTGGCLKKQASGRYKNKTLKAGNVQVQEKTDRVAIKKTKRSGWLVGWLAGWLAGWGAIPIAEPSDSARFRSL